MVQHPNSPTPKNTQRSDQQPIPPAAYSPGHEVAIETASRRAHTRYEAICSSIERLEGRFNLAVKAHSERDLITENIRRLKQAEAVATRDLHQLSLNIASIIDTSCSQMAHISPHFLRVVDLFRDVVDQIEDLYPKIPRAHQLPLGYTASERTHSTLKGAISQLHNYKRRVSHALNSHLVELLGSKAPTSDGLTAGSPFYYRGTVLEDLATDFAMACVELRYLSRNFQHFSDTMQKIEDVRKIRADKLSEFQGLNTEIDQQIRMRGRAEDTLRDAETYYEELRAQVELQIKVCAEELAFELTAVEKNRRGSSEGTNSSVEEIASMLRRAIHFNSSFGSLKNINDLRAPLDILRRALGLLDLEFSLLLTPSIPTLKNIELRLPSQEGHE